MDSARAAILIADDDRGVLDMVAQYFTLKGFDVRTAEDGLQAVILAAKHKPAVILLDYDMPAASGETVFRRLRGAAATAFTPIIFVTGKPEALQRGGVREGEKVRILRKPAALADIEAAVRGFLPSAAGPPPAAAAPALLAPPVPPPAGGGPRRILVVDDDQTIRDVLAAELSGAGFAVTACASGRAALARFQEQGADLVLLDLMLPGESGLDICRAIRAARGDEFVPVILLTARGGTESMVAGLDAGADEYLVKPHRVAELLARIRSMLRLKDAMERLSRADAFKEELLAITAHDLRNPLTAIKGSAEMLLAYGAGDSEESRRKALNRIVHCSDSMLMMLGHLHRRTRFESAELAARKVSTDPAALVADLVDKSLPLAQQKGVRLDWSSRLPAGYTAPLDPGLFEEVAANLVGNALKFTPAGGTVGVTVSSERGRLALAVADTGPGIAPDEQKAVFERFRRAAGARMSEGMGYGLAIVAKFAKLHGGTVELSSAPGRGSTFTVFFPEQ